MLLVTNITDISLALENCFPFISVFYLVFGRYVRNDKYDLSATKKLIINFYHFYYFIR